MSDMSWNAVGMWLPPQPLGDRVCDGGVRERGGSGEDPGDVWVWRELGWADALGFSLGLQLKVGELHLGPVDGVVCGHALGCEVVSLGTQLVELGEETERLASMGWIHCSGLVWWIVCWAVFIVIWR